MANDQLLPPALALQLQNSYFVFMSVEQIKQMTLEEKLQTMEVLWDELCRQDDAVPMPQWHKELLDERERLIEQGKARFVDWETAKSHISQRVT